MRLRAGTAGAGPFRAGLHTGDDPLEAAPAGGPVEELLEAARLAFLRRGLEARLRAGLEALDVPAQRRGRRGAQDIIEFPAYQRRTKQADALIAGAYLSGTNTRRVRRALAALFGGAVGKDTVSRVWREVKGDWDTSQARSLSHTP